MSKRIVTLTVLVLKRGRGISASLKRYAWQDHLVEYKADSEMNTTSTHKYLLIRFATQLFATPPSHHPTPPR